MFRSSFYLSFQDKEPPVLPSPTSLAFSCQTGRSPRDVNSLHFYKEEKAEWGQLHRWRRSAWFIYFFLGSVVNVTHYPIKIVKVTPEYSHYMYFPLIFPYFLLHNCCIGPFVKDHKPQELLFLKTWCWNHLLKEHWCYYDASIGNDPPHQMETVVVFCK